MIITATQHNALNDHLVATVQLGDRRASIAAPQAVHTAIAALVDPTQIMGSHAEYAHLRPTRWRVWVVATTHLAFVELEFDDDDYDSEEEARRINLGRGAANYTLVSAWARPLVAALKLKAAGIVRDATTAGLTGAFRLNQVAIEFADGTSAPAEGGLSCPIRRADGDSDRWDGFIAAIRSGSPYLTVELAPT